MASREFYPWDNLTKQDSNIEFSNIYNTPYLPSLLKPKECEVVKTVPTPKVDNVELGVRIVGKIRVEVQEPDLVRLTDEHGSKVVMTVTEIAQAAVVAQLLDSTMQKIAEVMERPTPLTHAS